MKVLMASVEFSLRPSPGGLGGIWTRLAQAMKRERAEVTLLAPFHGDRSAAGQRLARRLSGLPVTWGGRRLELPLWEGSIAGNVRVFFVEHESFSRPGIYGDGQQDWPDNPERFGLFCKAVAAAASGMLRPAVLHLHDWPMGLVPYYLGRLGGPRPPVVLSIYDLAYQGHYPATHLSALAIPPTDFTPENLEFFGHLNFLKAGLRHADYIVAMGRTHLRAITTHEGGHGMDGLLAHRGKALIGIPLGIDDSRYSPQRDLHLAQGFGVQSIGGKRVCKRALQDELGLLGRVDLPLAGVAPPLGRLLDPAQLAAALERIVGMGMQVVVQPDPGEPALPAELAERFPEELALLPPGDEAAYHRMLAGCDLLVVPSHFQPGRQPQREALRYGTLPLVFGEGVLEPSQQGRPLGFEVHGHTAEGLQQAAQQAVRLYHDQKAWRLLMLEGMSLDLSWEACARDYLDLFTTLPSPGTSDGREPGGERC